MQGMENVMKHELIAAATERRPAKSYASRGNSRMLDSISRSPAAS